MQKLVEIRRRIEVVRSIQTITRTMATVASAKLSRTRERAAGMREYTERLRTMIRRQQIYAAEHDIDLTRLSPYLSPRSEVRRVLVVHLAADRGMCGAYNLSANRAAARLVADLRAQGREVELVVKGARGERYVRKRCDASVILADTWRREGVTAEEVDGLYELLSASFLDGRSDEVWCVYTQFYSPLKRTPRAVRLLPLAPETAGDVYTGPVPGRWFYEPDLESVLGKLLSEFLRLQIEDVLLESYASEQGARMITMEEATERAARTLQDLTVRHNRLRREVITTDLLGVLFASRLRGDSGGETHTKGRVTHP